MAWYTFWINKILDGNTSERSSAEKVEIEGEDYYRGFMNFIQKYGPQYEITINGLSNREKNINLKGDTVTITCQGLKIINQLTIENGTLIISPKYDCAIIRSNLNNIKISFDSEASGQLFISGSKCSQVVFSGDGIVFDGPVEGDYKVEENKKEDINMRFDSKQMKNVSARNNIPLDVYQQLSRKLGTSNIDKILEAYNKSKCLPKNKPEEKEAANK